jgi:hypothetical protein
MAFLFPGCKVRKVRGGGANVGKTAVVVPMPEGMARLLSLFPQETTMIAVCWEQSVECYGVAGGQMTASIKPAGTTTVDEARNFEPILPDDLLAELREEELTA